MDALGIYMELKLDPFINEDMKDLWDSDLDQVINDYILYFLIFHLYNIQCECL